MLGGVYAVIAVGLSLAYGVMGILNWSHGEMLMLSMFLSYFLVTNLGMDPYVTAFVGIIVFFLIGYFLQKFVLNGMIKKDPQREPISVLLSTAGLGMILWNMATMVFSSNAMTATTSYTGKAIWMADNMLTISIPKVVSFVIAVIATVILYIFIEKTDFGRAMRATSQNREVARLMGINVENIYCLVFGLSLALVAVAGSLLIPNFSVYAKVGDIYSNKAFIIVVLGGKGNIRGALVGGIIIGIIERLGAVFFNESYGLMLTFVLFIILLLFRPNGMFSKKLNQM